MCPIRARLQVFRAMFAKAVIEMRRAYSPPDVLAPNANCGWPNISAALSGIFFLSELLEAILQRAALLHDINSTCEQNDSDNQCGKPVTALKYEYPEKKAHCDHS